MDEPTVEIDGGAKAEIYKLMSNLTQRGVSILSMSDRIIVMSDRCQVGAMEIRYIICNW